MAGRKPGASRPELNKGAWQKLRKAARLRDGNRCVRCRSTKGLAAHHVVPAWAGGRDVLENLQTLCSRCHHRVEPRRPRSRSVLASAGPWSRAW
jgi:5-methylcytosine-specific restriction endonuclease McrA